MRATISDEALREWLRDELGLTEYRRVVRESESAIVVSKFEPGFSQELFETVDLLPELFDDDVVRGEYERLARGYLARGETPTRGATCPLRTAVWREASEAVLHRLAEERGIDERRRLLVLPGIESVQAVLDAILWTAPVIGGEYEPNPGEVAEYEAFEAGLSAREGERDVFTRYYGTLNGRRVENYCPGAQFARRLVAQAWRICAGPTSRPSGYGGDAVG